MTADLESLGNLDLAENIISSSDPPEVLGMNQIIARQLDRRAALWAELQGGIKENKE